MATASRNFADLLAKYEPVIGLEVHAQLLTRTKLFCSCANRFGEEPNTLVCPVCREKGWKGHSCRACGYIGRVWKPALYRKLKKINDHSQ